MPHFWKNILVVTDEELIPDFYSTKQYLSVKLNRDAKTGEGLRKARNGGGGHPRLIEFDSLPKFIQEAIGDPRSKGHILENYYKRLSDAYNYYSNSDGEGFTYPDKSHLLPETIEQLTSNASVMVALQKLKEARELERKNKGASIRGVLRTIHGDAISFQKVMQEAGEQPHNLPNTYRYFQQAWAQFNEVGYIALIKDAKGIAKRNALKCDEAHEELLNNLFAGRDTKPSLIEVVIEYKKFLAGKFDIENAITGEVYQPHKFKKLGDSTIKYHLNLWENRMATERKRTKNDKRIYETYTPPHSFERPTYAGSIISVDDRNPPFEDMEGNRPWFYNGVDLASTCITTWVYGKSKTGIILEFYRQMVRNYHQWGWNLPYELEAERALNDSYKNTFLKNGSMFQEARIIPHKAWQKRSERVWRDLRYIVEKKDIAWIGRWFAKDESNRSRDEEKNKRVPYDKLIKARLNDIETYNNMPHPVRKDLSRFEYACMFQNENLPQTNYKSILPHLGYQQHTSCKRGIVQLQNGFWIIADKGQMLIKEDLINKMRLIEGKGITVYYIDGNDGEVIKAMVFDNGRYVCELIPQPKPQRAIIERTKDDWDQFNRFKLYTATVQDYLKERVALVDKVNTRDYTSPRISESFKIEDVSLYNAELRGGNAMKDLGKKIQQETKEKEKVRVPANWDEPFKV